MAETRRILQPIIIEGEILLIEQYECMKKTIEEDKELKDAKYYDYKKGWIDCLSFLILNQQEILKNGIKVGAIKLDNDTDTFMENIIGQQYDKAGQQNNEVNT